MTRSTLPAPPSARPATEHLAVLRSMLEQQRAFRVEQLAQLQRPGRPGPLGSADHEVLTSLAAGARAALRDVQRALWRMDDGRYGRCTACDDQIGLERLEILPQVALCMACQREAAA